MKSSQFLKLVLMPEHCLCTQFRQLKERIEFAPTPFIHTPQGNLTDAIVNFETLCLEHKTLVFPTFTLSPFSSSPSFQYFDLTFSSLYDSAIITRLSVYNSSHGQPLLNWRDRASINSNKGKWTQYRFLMYSYWIVNWVAIAVCDSGFRMSIVIHRPNNLNNPIINSTLPTKEL